MFYNFCTSWRFLLLFVTVEQVGVGVGARPVVVVLLLLLTRIFLGDDNTILTETNQKVRYIKLQVGHLVTDF